MAVQIRNLGDNVSTGTLIPAIREIFTDLEDQLNSRSQVYVSTNGKVPNGLNTNDVLITVSSGVIQIKIKGSKSYTNLTADMIGGLLSNGASFLGTKEGTATPILSDFPDDGDFGFFQKTTPTTAFYFCANINNNFKKVAMT